MTPKPPEVERLEARARRRAAAAVAAEVIARLGLVVLALTFVWQGAERIVAGSGRLLAGAIILAAVATYRQGPAEKPSEEEE